MGRLLGKNRAAAQAVALAQPHVSEPVLAAWYFRWVGRDRGNRSKATGMSDLAAGFPPYTLIALTEDRLYAFELKPPWVGPHARGGVGSAVGDWAREDVRVSMTRRLLRVMGLPQYPRVWWAKLTLPNGRKAVLEAVRTPQDDLIELLTGSQ